MNKSQALDELLILRCKDGDRRAFAVLVKRWQPKIIRHAYRMTGETAVAKDVAQETWIAVVKGLPNLRDVAAFKGWIYRIASNKCITWVRGQQKQRRTIEGIEIESEGSEYEDDKLGILKLELKKLPLNQQTILSLFYLENQSMRDISETLDIPIGTVKSRLYHSREHLKKRYYETYAKTRN